MKRLLCGVGLGIAMTLACVWMVAAGGEPFVQPLLAQVEPPEPTIFDHPIPNTVQSPTLSRDVLEYGRLFYATSRNVANSMMLRLGPILMQPRASDTDWILITSELSGLFTESTQAELADLEPPASTLEAHQTLVSALADCNQSYQYFGQGLESIQPTFMRLALIEMNSCANRVADATEMLLAIEEIEEEAAPAERGAQRAEEQSNLFEQQHTAEATENER